jgi:hypothetical protein
MGLIECNECMMAAPDTVALGLSRRTIADYLSGERVIPKAVVLATEGYDSRLAV